MATAASMAEKRKQFTTIKCPGCQQSFKAHVAAAESMKLPDDCPICEERARGLESVQVDPTAVVSPQRLLARQVALESVVRAMQQDLSTIMEALDLNPTSRTVVDKGTTAVPAVPA